MIRGLRRNKDPMASPPYLSLFKLREAPFAAAAGTQFFYADPERAQTLNMLQHLTQYSEELLLVSGPVGSGKTSLLDQYLVRADDDWKVCRVSAADTADPGLLFLTAARCFGLHTEGLNADNVIDALRDHLGQLQQSMMPVLAVDAAERLSDDGLEVVIRLAELAGEHGKLVRTLLFAEPAIIARLSGARFANMPKPHVLELKPLEEGQLPAYLHHRLTAAGYAGGPLFTARDIKRIHKGSQGWPGGVNAMAHEVLMDKLQLARPTRWRAMVLGGAAVGLAIGGYVALSTSGGGRGTNPSLSAAPARNVPDKPIVRVDGPSREAPASLTVRSGQTLQITCAAPTETVVPLPQEPALPQPANRPASPVPEPTPVHKASSAKTLQAVAPKAAAPKVTAPKVTAPKVTAPKAAAPKTAAPKAAAPKTVAPKTAAPKTAAPKVAAPKTAAPKVAAPKVAAPKVTAPKVTAPKVTAPKVTAPKVTAPKVTAPKAAAPKTAPEAMAPVIRRIVPNPVPGSTGRQKLTIVGRYFTTASQVTVAWAGHRERLPASRVRVIDAEHIAVDLAVGTRPAEWSLVVRSGELQTPPFRFRVGPARSTKSALAMAQHGVHGSHLVGAHWVYGRTARHFTVQLVGATTKKGALSQLDGHTLRGESALVITRRNGKPWYVLLWGDFTSRDAAKLGVARLPADLRSAGPWIRSFADVQAELRRGGVADR